MSDQPVTVTLTLHGILRDYLPRQAKGQTQLALPAGASVADVVQQLNIKQSVSAVVNQVDVDADYRLQAGDQVHLFRLIAGG